MISCGRSGENKMHSEELSYELVKIDSFTVENLTKVRITDYSESENIFLGCVLLIFV
jgi:hypothetical protein